MTDANTVDYSTEEHLTPSAQKTWAGVVHLLGAFIPLLPAVIGFILLKNRGQFVRSQTATALNFQLSMVVWLIAAYLLSGILMLAVIGFFLVLLVPFAYYVLLLVFSLLAAVRSTRGEHYKYPLSITFVH